MEELDPTVKQLASLALEIEPDASINWQALDMSREQAFNLISKNVYDQFSGMENQDEAAVVALATIVKLIVENLFLKAQLQQNAGQ